MIECGLPTTGCQHQACGDGAYLFWKNVAQWGWCTMGCGCYGQWRKVCVGNSLYTNCRGGGKTSIWLLIESSNVSWSIMAMVSCWSNDFSFFFNPTIALMSTTTARAGQLVFFPIIFFLFGFSFNLNFPIKRNL